MVLGMPKECFQGCCGLVRRSVRCGEKDEDKVRCNGDVYVHLGNVT